MERRTLSRYRLRRRLTTTVLCIAAAAVGPALAAERAPLLSEARTRGPYYADLEAPGALDEALRVVSDGSEVVLLHGNEYRARMLINLVAQLNGIGVDHILLLSFDRWLCDALRRAGRVGCVHSSYLTGGANDTSGSLAARADAWELAPRYRAWITKLYYMRLVLEKGVRILALDSDVVVGADPYESLRGAFGQYSLITAYDTKGGFANINVGVLYLQNVSIGGPVHGLFLEFEKRVRDGLALNPPETAGKRQWFAPRLFWDQNVFNKVLLSAIVERRVYLPDGSDDAWTRTHQGYLRLAGSPDSWERPDIPIKPAPELGVYEPWFSASPEYRQRTLRLVAGAPATARSERILLSPPWLIAADNALGHRYKHWLYGASPTPSMLLHFVCVATGEASRILPMRLFGAYHEEAVLRELRGLQEEAARSGGQTLRAKLAEEVASAVPGPLLALWPGSLDAPMKPHGWKRLNVMHTLLGGLAASADRRAVLPVLNCTGTKDRFIEPGNLPSRCFWHVHSKRGVGCVFRLGGCSEAVVAPPTELAMRERQLGKRPPSVTLDLRSLSSAAASGAPEPAALQAAVAKLDGARDAIRAYDLTGSPVVRLVLKLPPNPTKEMLKALDAATAMARLRDGVESFRSRCRELTDRSKKRRRECTNTC